MNKRNVVVVAGSTAPSLSVTVQFDPRRNFPTHREHCLVSQSCAEQTKVEPVDGHFVEIVGE